MGFSVSVNENECTFEAFEAGQKVGAVSWHEAKDKGAMFDARLVIARGRLFRSKDGRLWGSVHRIVEQPPGPEGERERWNTGGIHETGTWEAFAGDLDDLEQVGGDDEWVSEWWDMVAWSPLSAEREGDEVVFRRVDGWVVARVHAPLVVTKPDAPPPLAGPLVRL